MAVLVLEELQHPAVRRERAHGVGAVGQHYRVEQTDGAASTGASISIPSPSVAVTLPSFGPMNAAPRLRPSSRDARATSG